tara:strand:- start:304 stop:567 length:264 start_codon:yes stop_codon:yes gene_type:complete
MTEKNTAQKAHTIAVLFGLLAEYIDDFAPNSPLGEKIKLKSEEISPLADQMIDSVFSIKSVSQSTYINDLTHKVDTVIRKNFQQANK